MRAPGLAGGAPVRHADVWRALDALAAERGLSTNALGRKAGLDPLALAPNKRFSPAGQPRWPSTETVAKVVAAAGTDLAGFARLVAAAAAAAAAGGGPAAEPRARIPLVDLARAGRGRRFDPEGRPTGAGWRRAADLRVADPAAYALRVDGDGLRPVYRDGDVLVLSPAAPVRRGDRVVARTSGGALIPGVARRRWRPATPAPRLALAPLHPSLGDVLRFAPGEIAALHRVVWVGQ